MDISQVNWAYVGLGVFAVLAVAWIARLRQTRPHAVAIIVSVALLVTAGLNAVAPWRGIMDPHYKGYVFGYAHASAGWMVSVVAGSIFVLAAAGAFAALERKGRGWAMLTAFACLVFAVIIGGPWATDALDNPAANKIQLGEYLTIPGEIATWLLFAVLILPFLAGLLWAGWRSVRGR